MIIRAAADPTFSTLIPTPFATNTQSPVVNEYRVDPSVNKTSPE